MAPLYLGYAGEGGTVSKLLLDYYRAMAQSGVAMVVVENATVLLCGNLWWYPQSAEQKGCGGTGR
jgi:2,4-dienoyl-CoA reductase-like NADH-dependent reductase (Old Yellow Enzyme family)